MCIDIRLNRSTQNECMHAHKSYRYMYMYDTVKDLWVLHRNFKLVHYSISTPGTRLQEHQPVSMLVQSAKSNPNPTLHRSVLSVEHPRGEPLAYPLNDYVATITSYKGGKRQRDDLITTAACQYYHERRSCHSHILTLSVSFVVTNISSAQYKQSVTNVYLEITDLLILAHSQLAYIQCQTS